MFCRLICFSKFRKLVSFNLIRINTCSPLIGFTIFFFILWCTGLIDFFFEISFKKFKWPPFVDVRSKVINELIGNFSEKIYYNDWKNFSFLTLPICNSNNFTRRKFLLIIVKTAPNRKIQRNAIRSTYGLKQEQSGIKLRTVFVLGIPKNKDDKQELMNEFQENGDMLIGNFVDHYLNNTYKFASAIYLGKTYCGYKQSVPYLFLVNDNYLVSPKNLVVEALRHAPNEHVYMGWRYVSSPYRLIFRKFRVSLNDYPYSKYPPYIFGGAILLTEQTIKEFYLAIQYTAFFKFEDVYAGIMAYLLSINAQHNENFNVYKPEPRDLTEERFFWKSLIAANGFDFWEMTEKYAQLIDILALN